MPPRHPGSTNPTSPHLVPSLILPLFIICRILSLCRIHTVHGDLFTCPPTSSLGHCVSADLKMTRGIAQRFRNTFGCIDELHSQSPQVGSVVFLKHHGIYIYYIVTKEVFYQKPQTYDYYTAINAFRDLTRVHNITELAIPRLGCGLDHIPPSTFYSILSAIFNDDPITITVYVL